MALFATGAFITGTVDRLTIATRESPLALWQANFVADELRRCHPGLTVEILGMTTRGDQVLDSPLAKIGGKGLFVKELEQALLDGRADLAVHSAKDMPAELPQGLVLQITGRREIPFDALLLRPAASQSGASLQALPQGARVGTSSLRRKCQLLQLRPDLQIGDLRGNVNTRLAKLDRGDFDAIVLAAAGLQRLGMGDRISAIVEAGQLLPAVAQGALAVEMRSADENVARLLEPLLDRPTILCVAAERAMNNALEGGCQVPIAGYATLQGTVLHMRGRVGAVDGSQLIEAESSCEVTPSQTESIQASEKLGRDVAARLLGQGADKILADIGL